MGNLRNCLYMHACTNDDAQELCVSSMNVVFLLDVSADMGKTPGLQL